MNTAKPLISWLYSHTDFYMNGKIQNFSGPSEYLPNRFQLFENVPPEQAKKNENGIYNSIHKHENTEMILLISGKIDKIYIDGKIYSMSAGEVAIADSGVYHGIIERKSVTMITCIFDTDFINSMGINIENYKFSPIVKSNELDFIPEKMYKEMKYTPLYYYINMQNLAKELIIKVIRNFSQLQTEKTNCPEKTKVNIAKNTTKYIQAEYAGDINLEKLSVYLRYNSAYISRCFKEITGMTIWYYLNYVRCEHVKWLLKTTNFTMKVIAKKCGFSSEGYMTKVFKTYENISPSKLREAANAGR